MPTFPFGMGGEVHILSGLCSYNDLGDIMTKAKYASFLFICFITLLFLIEKAHVHLTFQELPLLQKVIYIDAGHGGRDPGTSYGNLLEKDLNLEIAQVLQEELTKKGAIVYMTREDDTDYSEAKDYKKKRGDLTRRIQMIEKENTDLYLSIHINWYKESYWKGAEVLYSNTNSNNKILGDAIMKRFIKDLKSTRHLTPTDLYMYNHTTVPGVLIECGFLSNPSERTLLQSKDYQKKLSMSITNGIIDYLRQCDEGTCSGNNDTGSAHTSIQLPPYRSLRID